VIKVNTATHFILVTKQPDGQAKKHVLCRVVARTPCKKVLPLFIVHSVNESSQQNWPVQPQIRPKDPWPHNPFGTKKTRSYWTNTQL